MQVVSLLLRDALPTSPSAELVRAIIKSNVHEIRQHNFQERL